MNKNIEEMKERTLKDISTGINYITKEDYEKLSENEKEGYNFDFEQQKGYVKQEKVETTEAEFNTYSNIKMLESLQTIKNIMIFFCVVVVINLLGTFYFISMLFNK